MKRTSRGKKILVVDDEESILLILDEELSSEGFNVQTVSGGEEAIKILKRSFFDLVILDLFMPRINGIEVLKFIQSYQSKLLNPDVKTIMLSGFTDFENVIASKKLGAIDFFYKPFDNYDIVTTVKKILN